jgi:hypothetical protein
MKLIDFCEKGESAMKRIRYYVLYLCFMMFLLFHGFPAPAQNEPSEWKFVSIPDFLNVDVNYPEPTWDDALDYVLRQIQSENPDFVLIAGDLVMGRWWRTKEQVEYMADIYYAAWIERMKKYDLEFYVVMGDHELGDNPWYPEGSKGRRSMGTWDCAPFEFVPYYEQAFVKHFKMPMNGPETMKGLTYSFMHNNTLFVAVDAFEQELLGINGQNAAISDQ